MFSTIIWKTDILHYNCAKDNKSERIYILNENRIAPHTFYPMGTKEISNIESQTELANRYDSYISTQLLSSNL